MTLSDILAEAGRLRLAGRPADALAALRDGLAGAVLKSNDYELCGRFVLDVLAGGPAAAPWPVLSIAVLGNYTTSNVAHAIRTMLLLEGFLADVYEAEYGVYRQEILDPASRLYQRPRDLVVLALGTRGAPDLMEALRTPGSAAGLADRMEADLQACWNALHARLACPVIQHTFEPLARSYVGPGEQGLEDAPDRVVTELAAHLRRSAPPFVYWLDTAGLSALVGHRNWTDLRLYYHGKFVLSPRAITAYAPAFLGLFRALWGRSRKCLVLDLDNTLWGGVVGDDGVAGIQLGPDTAAGEGYRAFCDYLLGLQRRGILLAVCSKNEERIARSVFETHPHMPLRLTDFSAFHCSWEDKPRHVSAIARELNLGLAHLAFFDDNPAECALMRSQLPEVTVLQAPADPALLVSTLDDAHLFDLVQVSAEDRLRAASYAGRQAAESLRASAGSVDDYLGGLDMQAICRPATAADTARLAQMEKKTNQFNFTTRRYDEAQLAELQARPDVRVLACWLRDRFADHGLVASAILVGEGADWRIDSWLMSCRVFSRTLEHAMVNAMAHHARQAGARRLVGQYLPTERNGVVKDLFAQLGFTCEPGPGPEPRWVLPLDPPPALPTFVTLADEATPVS
jgi:FkbH-like protein